MKRPASQGRKVGEPKMTPKDVHSRKYHEVRKTCLKQGLEPAEARAQAREAAKAAKAEFVRALSAQGSEV